MGSEQLSHEHVFQTKTNQSRVHPSTTSFVGPHAPGHYPPVLISPGPDIRQLGPDPLLHNLLRLFKLANPKPTYPVSSVPSHGNNVGSCPLPTPPPRPAF